MLGSIIEIYVPESELPSIYPSSDKKTIAERLCDEWSIFSGSLDKVFKIVKGIVDNPLFLSEKILIEPVEFHNYMMRNIC